MRSKILHATTVALAYVIVLFPIYGWLTYFSGLAPSDGQHAAFYAPLQWWTPHLECGYPVLAAMEWQTLYPLRWLFRPLPDVVDFNLYILSAFVIAACLTYGFALRATGSRFAAFVAGLVFAASGFMMRHLAHTSMIHATAWLPLVVWSVHEMRQRYTWQWLAIGACAVFLSFTGGHPQVTVYTLALAGCYALVPDVTGGRAWVAQVARCGGMVAAGTLFAAVQLLPTYELMSLSTRSSLSMEDFAPASLSLSYMTHLLFPRIVGDRESSFYHLPMAADWSDVEMVGYVGLLGLLLALVGMFARNGARHRAFWTCAALVSAALAMGDHLPLGSLIHALPVIGKFRLPARFFVLFSFAIAMLAARGVSALESGAAHRCHVRAACLVLVALFGVAIAAIALGLTGFDTAQWPALLHNRAIGMPIALLAVAAMALFVWQRNPASPLRCALLVLALIVDLTTFTDPAPVNSPTESLYHETPRVEAYRARLADGSRVAPLQGGLQGILAPNNSCLREFPSVSVYAPLVLSRYGDVTGILPSGMFNLYDKPVLRTRNRILDLLAVKFVVSEKPETLTAKLVGMGFPLEIAASYARHTASLGDTQRWHFVESIGTSEIYENLRALPRARLVFETVTASPKQILRTIRSSQLPDGSLYDPSRVALVEATIATALGPTDPDARATMVSQSSSRVVFDVETKAPAYFVASEIMYPGWRARIDGQPARTYRTDYVLRGVQIPAGSHRVEFNYRPKSAILGACFSLCAACCLLVAAWSGKRGCIPV